MPVISALGRLRQEDCAEFETSRVSEQDPASNKQKPRFGDEVLECDRIPAHSQVFTTKEPHPNLFFFFFETLFHTV